MGNKTAKIMLKNFHIVTIVNLHWLNDNSTQVKSDSSAGAVLAQKFWGSITLSAPSLTSPILYVLRNQTNTNST